MKKKYLITDIEPMLDPKSRYSRALQWNEWVMRASIAHDANDAEDRQAFHQRNQELNAIGELNSMFHKPIYYFTPMDPTERFSGFRALGLEEKVRSQITVLNMNSPLKDIQPDAVWIVDEEYRTLRVVCGFLKQARNTKAFCVIFFVSAGNNDVWNALDARTLATDSNLNELQHAKK